MEQCWKLFRSTKAWRFTMAELAAEYGISLKAGIQAARALRGDGAASGFSIGRDATAGVALPVDTTLILNCKRGVRDDGLPAIVP